MNDLISAPRLSELVSLIYDAAIDPSSWPLAMDAIRTELDFHNSSLNLQILPSGQPLTNVTCNIPTKYLALMEGAGADVIDQWGGLETLLSLPLDQPAVLTQVNPAFDIHTSTNRYYLDFAKPQGLIDVLAINLARSPQAIGTIAFGRHERAGPIGEREVSVAALLIPHLQRAATINRMLDAATMAHASFAGALDQLSAPVLLIASDFRIVHANPAGLSLLAGGEGLRSVQGVLVATNGAVNTALVVAVRQAAQDQSQLARRGLGIPMRGKDDVPKALHVLPLRAPASPADGDQPIAAVFVASADVPFVPPSQIVAALFDLTPAEARVFSAIAQGETLAEAAEGLGVQRSTAKFHLLRIYGKLGVSRQADLVRIAIALNAPVLD